MIPPADLPSVAGAGWMQWSPARNALRLSPASQALFGLTEADLPATLDDWLALVAEKDRNAYGLALERARVSGEPYRAQYRVACPADGRLLWIEERGGLIHDQTADEPHDRISIAALQWPRAACERLAADYDRLIERLRQADARKDEFLAMLAHELRNPLAPILQAAKLLRLIGSTEPRILEVAALIGRQSEHMATLVGDLLDVGRITRGTIDVDCEPTDVGAVVREAIEQTWLLIQARHHALEVSLPSDALWVLGDHVRLVQVAANLLSNAAKYTPNGGRIHVCALREGNDVVLRVTDTGIGIEADLLPHIFESFTQSTRTIDRRQGGLGLGLAIARGLVDMQGGFIEAASDGPGRGSRFTVRLPALAEPTFNGRG